MRLIDTDELNKYLFEEIESTEPLVETIKYIIKQRIDNAPTIDPVKHGLWIGTEFEGYADGFPVYNAYECSVCGVEYNSSTDDEIAYNYCPNCGAKMDYEEWLANMDV